MTTVAAIGADLVRGARPRILVATPDFPPARGGIQLLLSRLVEHWSRLEVTVVTLDSPGASRFDSRQPYRVRRVPRLPALGHLAALGRLCAATLLEARNTGPAVVLSGHVVMAPAAVALRRLAGIPFVQYVHGHEVARRARLAALSFRHAAAVITVSAHTGELARRRGADQDRLVRIHPGVDFPATIRRQPSTRPTVVTVARLVEAYKGHDVLVEALSLVRTEVPQVLWVVIGDGPRRPEYERLVRSLGLEPNVRFLGSVSDRERDSWLDRAHVMALPSRLPPNGGGEGFGIVLLEAAAHGLPVIAGNRGGPLDAVVDGQTGLLVDAYDPAAVATAITRLLSDPGLAEAMGTAARQRARDFAWPRVAAEVEELLVRVSWAPA